MWEFSIRIALAAALVAVSLTVGMPPFEVAWKIGALTGGFALVSAVLDRRGLGNPGMSGLFAAIDCLAISAALAYAGLLPAFGAAVVGPIVYATTKRGSNPLATGPIGAAAVISAEGLVSNAALPSAGSIAQAAIVIAVSLLINQPRVVVRPQTIRQMITELAEAETEAQGHAAREESTTQSLIELREKYRRLSTNFKELERKSRSARLSSKLLLSKQRFSGNLPGIADKLKEILEVDGVVLYSVNQVGDHMIVRATAGKIADKATSHSFAVTGSEAAHQLKQSAREAFAAIGGGSQIATQNILLRRQGVVVGVLTLLSSKPDKLDEIEPRAEEIGEVVSHILLDERERSRLMRRVVEAELLYEIAASLDGVKTESDLGRRAAKALSEILATDHIGIYLLDSNRPVPVGRVGKPAPLLESYKGSDDGVKLWIDEGCRAILAYSAPNSPILNSRVSLRYRVGSFIAMPIVAGDAVIGFLTAASSTDSALGPDDAKTLFDVAAELSHAFTALRDRANSADPRPHGILSVQEFQKEVASLSSSQACLVYLEPQGLADDAERIGSVNVEQVCRQLGFLARRHAPHDARICRKSDGGVVVLLPNHALPEATKWADNLSSVTASRVYEAPDGGVSVSLASTARVADLNAKIEDSPRFSAIQIEKSS